MKNKQLVVTSSIRSCQLAFMMLVAIAIAILTSCKKFVEIGPPPTEVATATVFSDSTAAASAMTGLYSQMMSTNILLMNGGATVFPALSADELTTTTPNPFYDEFAANAIPADNSLLQNNLWRSTYGYIYQCNAIIEGADKSTGLSGDFKRKLMAEARFDRAFCYFYLVNLFGDVPLVTTTAYSINATMPRTAVQNVYAAIETDLSFAKQNLPTNTAGNTRPGSLAATALIARLKLYQKDWATAEANATACINAGLYSLSTDLLTVFKPSSTETIWQLMPVQSTFNTAEANVFVPVDAATQPTYVLTPMLLTAFDTADARKTAWLNTVTINGQSYTFPYKYKEQVRVNPGTMPTEYNIVLRLAEQYLIRAEARAKQGNLTEATADINTIRTRAGLPNTVAGDESSLLLAIETEKEREFFTEWGHRWFDLKRTGRADAVLGSLKPGWQTTDALYPIPFEEIQSNPLLTQNPGY